METDGSSNTSGTRSSLLCKNEECRTNTSIAAYNGHIECLKYAFYMRSQEAHENNYPWHPQTTRAAASNGQLECLKYAHLHGCPWDPRTTYTSAINGHIECLKYIFEYCDISWEDADLEKDFDQFPKESQKFIELVREEWKSPGVNIKG